MIEYTVFLKHQKTGDTAVIHSPGARAEDAVARVAPALGEGWEARGAVARRPKQVVTTDPPKFKVVTFSDGPTARMVCEPFGPWDIIKRLAPHYAIFDLKQLWSFDYGPSSTPGHFIYLWKEMVMDDKGNWAYMSWEYNLGLEKALKKPSANKNGHLVYAVYEKVRGHEYSEGDLYKLVATRDV